MAKKRGFLGYNALLGDGSVMTSYTPTIGERMTDALRRMMFSDDRAGQRRAEKVMDVLSLTPVGAAADMYDAGREAGAGNYGTAGLMLGMAGIPGPSPKKGIRAFHGSPHSFERFDMSKIGTGEGAQAYGHGLYFAENEGVARGYRDALSNVPQLRAQGNTPESIAAMHVGTTQGDRAAARKALQESIAAWSSNPMIARDKGLQDMIAAQRAALDLIDTVPFNRGSMYEVNINADPEQFLDWDKPLSEQPYVVQKLRSMGSLNDKGDLTFMYNETPGRGGEMYERLTSPLAEKLTGGKGQVAATEALKKVGIPGIKYLDAGSRRAGDGTRNYVVFDERLIEIVRKYGIAGASAMLGYNLLEGMDPAQAEELKRIEGGR